MDHLHRPRGTLRIERRRPAGRRRRAAEGIEKAKAAGKFTGRKQSPETVAKCEKALGLIQKGVSKEDAAKAAGVGVATLYRFIKVNG